MELRAIAAYLLDETLGISDRQIRAINVQIGFELTCTERKGYSRCVELAVRFKAKLNAARLFSVTWVDL